MAVVGTTKKSGWAVFWFLLGFTIFGTAAVGTGIIGLLAGSALIVLSGFTFRAARREEGV
ncbi:MAG: hypothetical protein HYS07_07675 [Chlamydiae bacterium]|nr:hypothetical protein [Chlamydiota bacterium]MBI3277568.1 hypothetical protein [Chlamydiota bacterium]